MGQPSGPAAPRASCFVLFYPCGGLGNASARTRVFYYLPHLKTYHVRWHIASYSYHRHDVPRRPGLLSRLWLELLPLRNLIAFLRADTLFFQKKTFPAWAVRWGKRLGKRIVYDFDDALYLQPPPGEAPPVAHEIQIDEVFMPRLQWVLSQADEVVVSGEELAVFARQHARRVFVLPTPVENAAEKPSNPANFPVIGWVGAPENQRYLREIEQVLVRLQEGIPGLEIWILTSRLMEPPPRFRYRFIPWSLKAEAEVIPQFTVGVAPLDDDSWCRAKMNYKALVYLSHGVPAVVTPVGFPVDDFSDGRSILLASTMEEWDSRLRSVLTDPARRDELAAAGLEVVHRNYLAAGRAAVFASVLRGSV